MEYGKEDQEKEQLLSRNTEHQAQLFPRSLFLAQLLFLQKYIWLFLKSVRKNNFTKERKLTLNNIMALTFLD